MNNLLSISFIDENIISTIMYYITLVITFEALLFSITYLIINLRDKFIDIDSRSDTIIKIIKVSMWLSLIFGLLTCLLGDSSYVYDAIEKSQFIYFMILACWLFVIVLCGILLFIRLIFIRGSSRETSRAIGRLFKIALVGSIISGILLWLFL